MNLKKNRNIIVVGTVIILLVIVGLFITQGNKEKGKNNGANALPDVELIPTVGPGVKVTLEADAKKKEAIMEINGIPKGTDFIEYELSYNALVDGESVPKGVIGTIEYNGDDPVSRDITLGTCSSGTCKYDEGVNKVKVTLKFQGDYGAQLFEDEFEI